MKSHIGGFPLSKCSCLTVAASVSGLPAEVTRCTGLVSSPTNTDTSGLKAGSPTSELIDPMWQGQRPQGGLTCRRASRPLVSL